MTTRTAASGAAVRVAAGCLCAAGNCAWTLALLGGWAAAALGQPVWTAPPGGAPDGTVYAISTYSGNLVIGGAFGSVGGVAARNEARFRNGQWERLGDGLAADFSHPSAGYHNYVTAFYQDGGDLFMGGNFGDPSAEGAGVARFNGTEWFSLGTGMAGGSEVGAIHGYGGKIIIGGIFHSAGGLPAANIAAWDDNVWTTFSTGTFNGAANIAPVNEMLTFNGNLIIAGSFLEIDGVPARGVAQWNGVAWAAMGAGLAGAVYDLAVYEGELYACGSIHNGDGGPAVSDVARWDGAAGQWQPVGSVAARPSGTMRSLEVFDGKLYMGGFFVTVNSVQAGLAVWDGLAWAAATPGIGPSDSVVALHVHGGRLYAGGPFTVMGGEPMPYLAVLEFPCAADLDGNGASDVFDLLAYLDLWFTGDAAAELTGDAPAAIDVFDLLVYLDGWFAGC